PNVPEKKIGSVLVDPTAPDGAVPIAQPRLPMTTNPGPSPRIPLSGTLPPPPKVPAVEMPLVPPAQRNVQNLGSPPAPPFELPPSTLERRGAAAESSIQVQWVAPPSMRLGQSAPCQLVVSNTSAGPVQQVTVRLPLLPGVLCKSTDAAVTRDGNQLVWSVGALPPAGAQRPDRQLTAQAGGAINLPAQVSYTSACTISVRQPKLALKLNMPDKVNAGDSVTVNVTASNPGDGTAEQVRLKVQLPDGL